MGLFRAFCFVWIVLSLTACVAEEMADGVGADSNFGGIGSGSGSHDPDWSNTRIDVVYLAQTHVMAPDDPLFKLVGNRRALLKVQVVDPGEASAPEVRVDLYLGQDTQTLVLAGPGKLPASFEATPGRVQHSFENSFTVVIPAQWVQPGLTISVNTAGNSLLYYLDVGAPNLVKMKMFDVHYFGQGDSDYPAGTLEELEAKWPVSDLSVERIRGLNFDEMIIPARSDVGTPAVRISSTDEYVQKTGLGFDGEQGAALQWVGALSAAGGTDTAMYYINTIGVPAGGQAGGFNGVGAASVGILNHELGHALSLPHWGNSSEYPYFGDMFGIPAPDTYNATHVGQRRSLLLAIPCVSKN